MFMRRFSLLCTLSILLLLPLGANAATVSDVLSTPPDEAVTRGDFVRAAVQVLDIKVPRRAQIDTNFARPVPQALAVYVDAAEELQALQAFGTDGGWSRPILRGEALQVLQRLTGVKPAGIRQSFADVPAGSDLDYAVRAAVENEWMKPVKLPFFGVRRVLSGREAANLLRIVTGESTRTQTSEPKAQSVTIRVNGSSTARLPQQDLLQAVWQLLNDQYLYNKNIDPQEAAFNAAEGLVNGIGDPYTTFLRPANAEQLHSQLGGEITGIGAQVEYVNDHVVIVAPIAGSPAEDAGLQAGDIVLQVDGVDVAGMGLTPTVNRIRGPVGTSVRLRISRDGVEIAVTVKRATIKLPEIDISLQNGIAVVHLAQFGQTTERELRDLMADVNTHKPRGIILDLRNNPGGLLHAAELVVSNFLPRGSTVATISSRERSYNALTEDEPTVASHIPVVVLVNKGSASASEIVAGALQDAKRALIIGEKTFGKGTVQQIIDFTDGSSLKMTIAEWFTPLGRKIDKNGIEPDVVVPSGQGRDDQMLRAIDQLNR